MPEFFKIIITFLNGNNIAYMLSGSVAMSAYVLPRATKDFDFIIHLKPSDVSAMAEFFKEGYYCDIESIKEAVRNKSMFNIIDHASGFKADFFILKDDAFQQSEFNRRKKVEVFGITLFVVSPEDLILSKLIWIQQFQSAIQIQDINQLLKIENLDENYIQDWIKTLRLNTFALL